MKELTEGDRLMAACDQCGKVINSEKEASVIIEVINHEKRGRRDLCWSCCGELARSVGFDLVAILMGWPLTAGNSNS